MSNPQRGRSWRERWVGWRNAVIGDPAFQRFAARFPLTRPIARMRARALFDLVAGFTYSQTLFACVQTGILESLGDGPSDTAGIAASIGLPLAGADRLLRAAVAIGLVDRLGPDRWALGPAGAAMRGNPGIAEMVAHHHLLYADLADPVALLRRGGGGGALAGYWHYAGDAGHGDGAQVAEYSRLMAASQPMIAQQVLDAYRFDRHDRLLDVGGGEGAFVSQLASRTPGLRLSLFDLPAVGARARARAESAGFAERLTVFGGSFLCDPLPAGHDIVTLVRVLHDHDDAPAMTLLRAVAAALPIGGTLLIAEPMAETPGAAPAGDAYFGLYLLAMGSGRPRSPTEIAAMLRTAGFAKSRLVHTQMPLTARIILATR